MFFWVMLFHPLLEWKLIERVRLNLNLLQMSLYALYRSFKECAFIEKEGGIVFYKNAKGVPARVLAKNIAPEIGTKKVDVVDMSPEAVPKRA